MPLTEKEKRMVAKLVKEQKFVDKEFKFPSDEETLKRPHELVDKPQLFVDGPSHMDVRQEDLGDCWFLSAASVVAQHPHLLYQVIPQDQCLYGKEYQGILVFRFWNLGQWKTVYIDDTLAVNDDDELIYGRCTNNNEFWLPLLQKAFAKYHGGYPCIEGGFSSEAFLSLTGYIIEDIVETKLNERQLYDLLATELQHNSLLACGTMSGDEKQGIAGMHAYSVTGAYIVRVRDSFIRLVRVRNPWGDVESAEWTGAFSDSDPKWTGVDAETRKKLEFVKDEDGQFFMRVSHFKRNFPEITVASRFPNFGDCYETPSQQMYMINNVWDKGIILEGNGMEFAENFLRNPRYLLTVGKTDNKQANASEEEENGLSPNYDVIIQLLQDQNRIKYFSESNRIGLRVFQTGGRYPKKLVSENLEEFEPHKDSVELTQCCSIVAKLRLEAGEYIVVPFSQFIEISRPFLMRLYSRKPITIEPIKNEE